MSNDTMSVADSSTALIGRNWWLMLFGGIITIIIGLVAITWPQATVAVIAILLAIYLLVSGIFEFIRGFASGLTGGMRALLFISGVLSVILGLLMFRSAFQAVEILGILIGIAFLFRAFGVFFLAADDKNGRGWNIFFGIVLLLAGIVLLAYPVSSVVTLAWIIGIWLIVIGLFEIIGSFMLKSAAKKAGV